MEDTNISNVIQSLKTFIESQQWGKAYSLLIKNQQAFDEGVYHYNLGVVKANLNDLAGARYHLEMSKMTGFSGPEVVSGLKSIKEQLNINFLENNNSIIDIFYRTSFDIPSDFYLFLSLILTLIVVLNLKRIDELILKVLMLFAATLPALFLLICIETKSVAITTAELSVSEGPSRIFKQVEEVPLGAKIIIGNEYNGWKEIVYPEKLRGWFFSDRYKLLRD